MATRNALTIASYGWGEPQLVTDEPVEFEK